MLGGRTSQLNDLTVTLNMTTGRIDQLNGQVQALEARQRSLASEKAHVEDQKAVLTTQSAALAAIVRQEQTCVNDLGQLLVQYANGNYQWVSDNEAVVGSVRRQANADFDAFRTRYRG